MLSDTVFDTVNTFLAERGYAVHTGQGRDDEILELASLDYVALLLHVERDLSVNIDDAIFFAEGLPETLGSICQRLTEASTRTGGE
jgi:acyl carrier protein